MRNEEECVCSACQFRCNIFIGFRIIKEMPGLVGSGTPYMSVIPHKLGTLRFQSPEGLYAPDLKNVSLSSHIPTVS